MFLREKFSEFNENDGQVFQCRFIVLLAQSKQHYLFNAFNKLSIWEDACYGCIKLHKIVNNKKLTEW